MKALIMVLMVVVVSPVAQASMIARRIARDAEDQARKASAKSDEVQRGIDRLTNDVYRKSNAMEKELKEVKEKNLELEERLAALEKIIKPNKK